MYESLLARSARVLRQHSMRTSASGVIGDATFCLWDNEFAFFAWLVMAISFYADTDSRTTASDARWLRTRGRVGDVALSDTGGCAP